MARVQSASARSLNVLSLGVTLAALGAGHAVLAAVSVDSATQTITGVSDGTHAFVLLDSVTFPSGVGVYLYGYLGSTGATPTITATSDNAGASIAILAWEDDNVNPGTTLATLADVVNQNSGNTATVAALTATAAAAGEEEVAIAGDWGQGITWTVPAGMTGDANNLNGSSIGSIMVAYGTTTGAAESHGYTVSAATTWGQILAMLKKPAAAAAPAYGWSTVA